MAITPLPTPPPSRNQTENDFVNSANALFGALPDLVTEINAESVAIVAAVGDAEDARDAAIAAATATTVGTSASSVVIGTGAKAFTTQAGKNWIVGTWLVIASAADPANYMTGQVTAYSGTSLTVDVEAIGGAGTLADWNISLSGPLGVTGAPGVNGNGAWTQIGSTVNTTSGTSVTFSSIPGTFSDLRVEFDGVSPSTTATLTLEISDNGTNWSSPATLVLSAGASDTIFGSAEIPHYARGSGAIVNGVGALSSTREVGNLAGNGAAPRRLPGAITHVRIALSTGNFDAGAIRLFGRQQV